MTVLVACEFSGVVSQAFIRKGIDAISCDLLPSDVEDNPYHLQCDVLDLLEIKWDLIIAHPPCTYLCNSGVRWLYEQEGRWDLMEQARDFFMSFYDCKSDRICIENPIPHCYAALPPYNQKIQPYQFGHGETKATCLWLKNLPKLLPTNIVSGREARVHKVTPGPDRWKERSRTYQGIADAMASQWGRLL